MRPTHLPRSVPFSLSISHQKRKKSLFPSHQKNKRSLLSQESPSFTLIRKKNKEVPSLSLCLSLENKEVPSFISRVSETNQARIKIHELRGKTKAEFLNQLNDLKAELAPKVTSGAPNKLSKMY